MKTETLHIGGMTCTGCEGRIRKALQEEAGIVKVKVRYQTGTAAITYNPDVIRRKTIIKRIEAAGYEAWLPGETGSSDGPGHAQSRQAQSGQQLVQILLALALLYFAARHTGLLNLFNLFPQAQAGMGYGALFLIGLFTSLHCTAMCGGIQLSQCLATSQKGPESSLRPSLLYNTGRVLSYTLVGAVVGALGSVISVSSGAKGLIQLAAGLFMILMGINLLGIFPGLRRFMPQLPALLPDKAQASVQGTGPLYVGLLNGLMPCGPLQAMQLYALSTGSPVNGALSMFLFSLGTVPVMLGLGTLSSLLSRKYTRRLTAAGAILVVFLGASMFSNGLALSGVGLPGLSEGGQSASRTADGFQMVETQLSGGRYAPITVEAGTPVRWVINAPQGSITGCNRSMIIPEYGLQVDLTTGENVIEFTPTQTGTFLYTCWMGMIRSTITVVAEGDEIPVQEQSSQPVPQRRQIEINQPACCQ